VRAIHPSCGNSVTNEHFGSLPKKNDFDIDGPSLIHLQGDIDDSKSIIPAVNLSYVQRATFIENSNPATINV
jgi:hypothetical protein